MQIYIFFNEPIEGYSEKPFATKIVVGCRVCSMYVRVIKCVITKIRLRGFSVFRALASWYIYHWRDGKLGKRKSLRLRPSRLACLPPCKPSTSTFRPNERHYELNNVQGSEYNDKLSPPWVSQLAGGEKLKTLAALRDYIVVCAKG